MANGYDKLLRVLMPDVEDNIRNFGSATVFGVVKSIDPLIINVDDRIELDDSFFILSPFCYDYFVDFKKEYLTTTDGDPSHNHKVIINEHIKVWRGLKVGDTVNMIMSSDKQKYYIINYQDLEVGED